MQGPAQVCVNVGFHAGWQHWPSQGPGKGPRTGTLRRGSRPERPERQSPHLLESAHARRHQDQDGKPRRSENRGKASRTRCIAQNVAAAEEAPTDGESELLVSQVPKAPGQGVPRPLFGKQLGKPGAGGD